MEVFRGAKVVRLRNEQNKYLAAEEDEENVRQSRQGSSNYAFWFVESIYRKQNAIRLKNRQTSKYLGAFDAPFVPGMTSKRVIQSFLTPRGSDTCVDWTPIKEGTRIRLRTRGGDFLRANGGPPPWKNSITHDAVSVTDSLNSFLWTVDVVTIDLMSTDGLTDIQVNYQPSSVHQGASYFQATLVDATHAREEICDGGPLNRNRWKILLTVTKVAVRLTLLLREAYKVQEKMRLHCCLLPRDYEFERDTLVQLWMAAGYLSDERMEAYGRRYFDILLNIQMIVFSGIDTFSGERKYSTNVPGEMLKSKEADLFTILKDEFIETEVTKSWHVSLVSDDISQRTFDELKRCKDLKTLLFVHDYGPCLERVPSDIFLALPAMEALDLSGSHITELPGSIGNMRLLRYLNLSFTLIESLPETISRLQELQTLNLEGCKQLYALPKGFRKLVNLRHLYFDILGQLSYMPRGIGGLTQLRTLSAFIVDDENGCNIQELMCLNNLSGSCCISGLEKVIWDTNEAVMKDKMHLTHLQLRWTEYNSGDRILESFDMSYLEPHACLEELEMSYYPCRKLPGWICEEKFKWLNTITLRSCKIPVLDICLGSLPNLEYLYMIQMNMVEVIDDSIHALPGQVSFPKLQKLKIDGMLSLISWTGVNRGDFPLLSVLSLKHCPKISLLPFLPFLSSLELLEIVDCTVLESLSDQKLPNKLQTLMVDDCPVLSERYFKEGAEWCKIKHVQHIWFDLEDMHSLSTNVSDSKVKGDADGSRTRIINSKDDSSIADSYDNACPIDSLKIPDDQNVSTGKQDMDPYSQTEKISYRQNYDKEREKNLRQIQLLKNILKLYQEKDKPKIAKWLLPEYHGLEEKDTVKDDYSSINNEIEALLAAPAADYSKIVSELVNKNAKLQGVIRFMHGRMNTKQLLLRKKSMEKLQGQEHEACATDSDVRYQIVKGGAIESKHQVEELIRIKRSCSI